MPDTPDDQLENHGSIVIFQPMTATARTFLEEHCQIESWQWWAGRLAVDLRIAVDLAAVLQSEGFTVR